MQKLPLRRRVVRRLMLPFRRVRNSLCYRLSGGAERPVFHDVQETRPELLEIDRNFDAIQAEMNAILSEHGQFPRYHEADESQAGISDADDKNWRVFFLYLGRPYIPLSNATRCPRTVETVRRIPGITAAFFSILEPGKSVPAHEGPSYTYLRYHTALKVPEHNPPKLRVKDRFHTWKEGQSVLFDDSWEHEVINESDDIRVVLIVDFERPMPWPVRAYAWIVLKLSALAMSSRQWAVMDERVKARGA
jgi:aspartyl/asparaginyl beta-hydroxylase (cupin superfamily)